METSAITFKTEQNQFGIQMVKQDVTLEIACVKMQCSVKTSLNAKRAYHYIQ